MIGTAATSAVPVVGTANGSSDGLDWHAIDWHQEEETVRRLRQRIACMEGLTRGLLAVEVVAADAGIAQLDGRHDVQDPTDLAVPGAREPVTDVVAR